MKTWHFEWMIVGGVLAAVAIWNGSGWIEWAAVLFTFGHASIAERMAETQAGMTTQDVHCHAWSRRYFFTKEILWLVYFTALGAYSALVGVGVFLQYPFWRKAYRHFFPAGREPRVG